MLSVYTQFNITSSKYPPFDPRARISLIQIGFAMSIPAPKKRNFNVYMDDQPDVQFPAFKKIALKWEKSTRQHATATVGGRLSDEASASKDAGRDESGWNGVCSTGYRDTGRDNEEGNENEVYQEVGDFL